MLLTIIAITYVVADVIVDSRPKYDLDGPLAAI